MSGSPAAFNTPHNAAFHQLGALKPGQHWSAFDVHRNLAQRGEANIFVMTIWNEHSEPGNQRPRISVGPAIGVDRRNGTFWYLVHAPQHEHSRRTAVAHWSGLRLALDNQVPIVGVLKDIRSGYCSLDHTYDCGNPCAATSCDGTWLQLMPRNGIGCALFEMPESERVQSPSKSNDQFLEAVHQARLARLASAPRSPARCEKITQVFARNADVVVEVLFRANGICESCGKKAPFVRRTDGSPYLEVHHRTLLSEGGDDVVENAIALCPNCHRSKHYG